MKIVISFFLVISLPVFCSQTKDFSFGERFLKEFSTPVTTDAKYILGGAILSAGMVYINKGRRVYDRRETFEDARPLGKYGGIGDVLGWGFLNGIYTLSFLADGLYSKDSKSLEASEHMFKASFYTLVVTASLKTVVNERRPGYPEDRSSFPSGHASMSFAFASVVASRHGWAYGSLAYGVASYISVSRINDDWHYLHDVLTGMGIGAAYGWGLSYAYAEGLPFQFALVPMKKGMTASFTYNF